MADPLTWYEHLVRRETEIRAEVDEAWHAFHADPESDARFVLPAAQAKHDTVLCTLAIVEAIDGITCVARESLER